MTSLQILRVVKAAVAADNIYVTANRIGIQHSTLTRFLFGQKIQERVALKIASFAEKPPKASSKKAKKAAKAKPVKAKKAKAPKKVKAAKKAPVKKAVKASKPKAKKPSKPRAKKVKAPTEAPKSTPEVEAEEDEGAEEETAAE